MLVADKIADIHSIPRLSRGQESLFGGAAPYMGMPTGMSINANHLLVTTMQNAYLLNRDNLVEPAQVVASVGEQKIGDIIYYKTVHGFPVSGIWDVNLPLA